MPNQRDPSKQCVTFHVDRSLARKAHILAERAIITLTSYLTAILVEQTAHIQLSPTDYAKIARDTRKAIEEQRKPGTVTMTVFCDPALAARVCKLQMTSDVAEAVRRTIESFLRARV